MYCIWYYFDTKGLFSAADGALAKLTSPPIINLIRPSTKRTSKKIFLGGPWNSNGKRPPKGKKNFGCGDWGEKKTLFRRKDILNSISITSVTTAIQLLTFICRVYICRRNVRWDETLFFFEIRSQQSAFASSPAHSDLYQFSLIP